MQDIMIGIPIYDGKEYCLKRLVDFLRKLDNKLVRIVFLDSSRSNRFYYNELQRAARYLMNKGFKVNQKRGLWKNDVGYRIVANRNLLRRIFLQSFCSHLFMLDADVIPDDDKIVEKFLKHDVDVVHAVCPITKIIDNKNIVTTHIYQPEGKLDYKDINSKFKFVEFKDLPDKGLVKVVGIGLGCCLVKKKVVEKIEFRVKDGKKGWFVCEDLMFCADLHKKNIIVQVDCGAKCAHYVGEKS